MHMEKKKRCFFHDKDESNKTGCKCGRILIPTWLEPKNEVDGKEFRFDWYRRRKILGIGAPHL